jgi:hypothetical protein
MRARLRRLPAIDYGSTRRLTAIIYLAVFAATVIVAYWALFSQWQIYDDEGFFEHGIGLFIQGHLVYNQFYTDYGPFPYELWGLVFGLIGRTLTTDSGRLIQTAIWTLSSLGLGLASHRLSRRLTVGVSVQALSFGTLWVMQNEPMHAGGLIVLLLTLIVCAVVFGLDHWPRASLFAIGALVACITLSKLNLGGYAFVALAFATVMAHPRLRVVTWARWVVSIAFVAVAPVVMYRDLGDDWAQRYAVLVAAGALALIMVIRSIEPEPNEDTGLASGRHFVGWLAAGLATATIVVVGVVLVLGSSLRTMIDDVVVRASHQSSIATVPVTLGPGVLYWAVGAIAVAVGLRRSGAFKLAARIPSLVTGSARLTVGLAIWMSIAGIAPFSIAPDTEFALAMALAWVVVVPARGEPAGSKYFARVLIASLALLEGLDAYPLAGSQVGFGAVLFLVCGAICVADGWTDIEAWTRDRVSLDSRKLAPATLLGACAVALTIGFAYSEIEQPGEAYRAQYDANVALDFYGATHLRVPPAEAAVLDQVVALLKSHCDNLLSLPGQFSFNDWTGLPSPGNLVSEEQDWGLTSPYQAQALATARAMPRLCILESGPVIPAQVTGLIEYIEHDFRPIANIGTYTVEVRDG